uniref:Aspartic proteinase nepenthesin-1 n=1 Tax=Aegilops tauschii TaxID=37682 RepID=M8CNN9_AEGTA
MALLVPLLVLLLFSSSCGTSSSLDISHGATAASVGEELNYYVVVETTSLEPSPVCQGHRVSPSASGSGNLTGGAWVPLSHPNGPCSEAGNSGAPWSSAAETLQWDQHRAGYIQRKLSGDEPAGDDDEPPLQQPQASGVTSEPAAKFALPAGNQGKSEVTPTATVGGGSLPGVTQHMVIDTASDVPWVQCAPCPKPQCHPQTDATYDPSKSTTYAPFPCSSPVCRQLGPYANGCTGAGNTGQCQYRVQISASKYVLTPMLKSKMVPSMYLVRLRGIDVAGQRVAVPPMVFAAGAVMDSRTVITRLQPTAYRALRDAFRAQMGAYRVAPPKGQLDTCYDFTGVRTLRLPKISLVFDSRSNSGAAVELDPSGVLFNSCLAFASTGAGDGSTGVIGHVQQRTIEVLYNVGGSAVGFRRAAC